MKHLTSSDIQNLLGIARSTAADPFARMEAYSALAALEIADQIEELQKIIQEFELVIK